ncbi:MAG TPA: GH92 family glycosyl hydrolase [Pyrinomonadaceae bacterium]|nr:hypothetical protein [Blastocatellia bacterium]HRJ89764.1 GH92 family glycosyl hydrolase [Pyrinomonadaceae bacterium]HRK49693.1 GH92 family glycosyl hydrolase [Pyrinomonadaceae bacterium]
MLYRAILFSILLGLVAYTEAQTKPTDLTRWVNPFIGTGGHGHTFPGATMPFGMVQLSPDTRIDNWDGSSGYHYSDDIIYGFSHTHLSGTGIPDGADILFMPTVGEPQFFAKEGEKSVNGYASKFSHANEKAEPGYYAVKLDDDGILAELTATKRVGFHRYSFSTKGEKQIVLDLGWRDQTVHSDLFWDGTNRIEGSRESTSWAKKQKVYFVAEFSRPFETMVTTSDATEKPEKVDVREIRRGGNMGVSGNGGTVVSFGFPKSLVGPVLLKVAISYVSIDGARKNLEAELPHWDFDKVRADAKSAWNKELSKIEVSGGTDEQTTNFYTALYHTMIHPNVFNDVDGKYLGHDRKIHQLPGYSVQKPARKQGRNGQVGSYALPNGRASASDHYTVFSLWDTFRAAHPLYTIIDQKRTVDFINTFIRMYEQGGRLPVWELWGEETDTMIGYHAVSVIADAMAKGIKGFDYEKAYAAAKHSAELDYHGLAAYKKRGYVSGEDDNESVSKTLEYAYNDWCLMKMGSLLFNLRSLNKAGSGPNDAEYLKALSEDIDKYRRRSGNFENLFDHETKFFRPKRNGGFIKPFAPQEVTFHFTEGNSWQYSFFVPHDVSRLMQLMGGEKQFVEKLDELFTTDAKLSGREQPDITGLMGQYAHGNEPSHHIAYLYNYAGAPSKTQERVRRIMDEFYKPTPDGLIGNEDCGQMSAWYVLSAAGFYPVAPGQETYDLGSPIFKQVTFDLENGKKFIVRAPQVSPSNFYIKSAKLNGKPLDATVITHYDIARGSVLEIEMSDQPHDKAFSIYSPSSVYRDQAAVPVIDGERVFASRTSITLKADGSNSRIHYTLDGSEPSASSPVYNGPIEIDRTTAVKAFVVRANTRSLVAEAVFAKRPNDWTVKLESEFNSQYPGSSYDAIIDGLRGNHNFAAGEWQGFWGKTFEAVIDLQRETEIREVGGSFLQSARSWIWMPDRLVFEVSNDGTNFTSIADWKPGFPQTEMNGTPKEFLKAVTPVKARYVRVRAHNFGKIPSWHPGAGGDPWIFVDEIFVR